MIEKVVADKSKWKGGGGAEGCGEVEESIRQSFTDGDCMKKRLRQDRRATDGRQTVKQQTDSKQATK